MLLDNFLAPLSDLPDALTLFGVFILSACIGSFLTIVIYRLPTVLIHHWQSEARYLLATDHQHNDKPFNLLMSRPHCCRCQHPLGVLENIPILSYAIQGGKCRHCRAPISPFDPMIELICAVLGVVIVSHFGITAQSVWGCCFVFVLITLAGIDAKSQLLPDALTLPLMWLGIILGFWSVFIPLTLAVAGAIIGYLSLWFVANVFKLITKKDGMGLGDAKLLAAIFTWLPIDYFPIVLLIASVSGIIFSIIQLFFKGQSMLNRSIPFGPHLALGAVISLLYGQAIEAWYLSLLYQQTT
ncbi:MAG: prepilin peptidase [Gammaproteobacteria bacterium]|nr:MAG: prepilin peptidase [Gammaproteobacteria bacterium]